jgi:hypothetical protein
MPATISCRPKSAKISGTPKAPDLTDSTTQAQSDGTLFWKSPAVTPTPECRRLVSCRSRSVGSWCSWCGACPVNGHDCLQRWASVSARRSRHVTRPHSQLTPSMDDGGLVFRTPSRSHPPARRLRRGQRRGRRHRHVGAWSTTADAISRHRGLSRVAACVRDRADRGRLDATMIRVIDGATWPTESAAWSGRDSPTVERVGCRVRLSCSTRVSDSVCAYAF